MPFLICSRLCALGGTSHALPDRSGGEREKDRVSSSWTRPASELPQQHRPEIRGGGSEALSAERWRSVKPAVMMKWAWALRQDDVSMICLTGLKESIKMSLTDSELLIEIMDEARRQVGVVYLQDSQWLASIPWLTWLDDATQDKEIIMLEHLCNKK